ncbi:MAG: helix-turn-helix transcriptional regulator [Ktedonobacteraceae bacterium]|nr:helix-turn-helix transcriptional regulator [Ktedonobacteraceae bacterium]
MIRLKVKEIAAIRGISQRRLAKLTDMDVRHIQRILHNPTTSITMRTLDKLAQALNVDASLLIESDPPLPKMLDTEAKQ